MLDLDSLAEIAKLDSGKILESIRALPDQFAQAWNEVGELTIPDQCRIAKNIIVCGMGGSALGGRVIDSLEFDRIRVPIETVTDYKVPNYVSSDTLVILSSYSGNTEETIWAGHEAYKKGAQIFGITTGGKLGQFLKENNLASYIFDPKHNPSGQPRMGLDYSIAALLAVLCQCDFIHVTEGDLKEITASLTEFIDAYDARVPESENQAKVLAKKLLGKAVAIVASDHLIGICHAFKNQLNENSKTFSMLFELPEANHHLMEGLRFPPKLREVIVFLFFESDKYSEEVQRRYPITTEVVERNGYPTATYTTIAKSRLSQIFEILVFGSYVSFYLAMLNEVDPTPIPWVDYFKQKLSEK